MMEIRVIVEIDHAMKTGIARAVSTVTTQCLELAGDQIVDAAVFNARLAAEQSRLRMLQQKHDL